MNRLTRWTTFLMMGTALAVLSSGCMKKTVKATIPEKEQPVKEAAADEEPFKLESVLGEEWKEIPQLAHVRFEFDQSSLTSDAKTTLQKNVKLLKEYPQMEVRVAGHCDDRGTVEYNIALGQKRARAVRDYYKALGVSANRLTTISFGEERPLCSEASENCWTQNRRAETRVRILAMEAGNPSLNSSQGKMEKTIK